MDTQPPPPPPQTHTILHTELHILFPKPGGTAVVFLTNTAPGWTALVFLTNTEPGWTAAVFLTNTEPGWTAVVFLTNTEPGWTAAVFLTNTEPGWADVVFLTNQAQLIASQKLGIRHFLPREASDITPHLGSFVCRPQSLTTKQSTNADINLQ